MTRSTHHSHKKSSRIDIDRGMLGALVVIALFSALLALVNGLNVSASFQQGQAFNSTRCLMNEFSSSISTSPGAYNSIIMTRSAPTRAEYKCDAPQNVIDHVAISIKSQDPFSITCNDGSTLRGAKCMSSMLGQGSSSYHTCLSVGSLGANASHVILFDKTSQNTKKNTKTPPSSLAPRRATRTTRYTWQHSHCGDKLAVY